MSLSVHARHFGSNAWIPLRSSLAGSESWRTMLWGSEPVKALGFRILPSLAHGDVFASGHDLLQLESEVQVLQRTLCAVVDALIESGVQIGYNDRYEVAQLYLNNIAEAVRRARAIRDGEVVIW